MVASSILAPGTNFLVYTVYVLRGASGRHYIGQTSDLSARLAQHRAGHTHTTKRMGGTIELIASREFASRTQAVAVERMLKAWKNPLKAIAYLHGGLGA
ncbi:GIY-YIG nuclease family protein [Oleiharenicola lentus]|uniref:GIY-YIG nuclease family protein n=1 Tax=Oleiharenicola lentus TaxID=2508720 RepID=A0A4Q1CBD9_9BACT|nr:GIY-YIG nuclease family protein [Oleiharenicola lentus]